VPSHATNAAFGSSARSPRENAAEARDQILLTVTLKTTQGKRDRCAEHGKNSQPSFGKSSVS
jgi:hypothetical protein